MGYMNTDQVADKIWPLNLPKKKVKPKMKNIMCVVWFLEEKNNQIQQVIIDMLIARIKTAKERMLWISRTRHRFRHKYKKKVVIFLPLRVYFDQVFKMKRKKKPPKSAKIKHRWKKKTKDVMNDTCCLFGRVLPGITRKKKNSYAQSKKNYRDLMRKLIKTRIHIKDDHTNRRTVYVWGKFQRRVSLVKDPHHPDAFVFEDDITQQTHLPLEKEELMKTSLFHIIKRLTAGVLT